MAEEKRFEKKVREGRSTRPPHLLQGTFHCSGAEGYTGEDDFVAGA